MQKYDVGLISAYRDATDCNTGKPLTRAENERRSRDLLAKLRYAGYSVARVKGRYYYKDGKVMVASDEKSFFVVDDLNIGNLRQVLVKLGIMFEQDSIVFSPAGHDDALLIGTNRCPNNWVGFMKVQKLGNVHWNIDAKLVTVVKNGEFTFGLGGGPKADDRWYNDDGTIQS